MDPDEELVSELTHFLDDNNVQLEFTCTDPESRIRVTVDVIAKDWLSVPDDLVDVLDRWRGWWTPDEYAQFE